MALILWLLLSKPSGLVRHLTFPLQFVLTMADKPSEDEQRKSALSGLSPTDPTINHRQACKKHQKGTGTWFIQSERYSDWISTAGAVLWINGIRMLPLISTPHRIRMNSRSPLTPHCMATLNVLQLDAARLFYGMHELKIIVSF